MLIGKFSKTVGFSPAAIRFYESKGFFSGKRSQNAYRNYDFKDVEDAEVIKLGKALGFTLNETQKLSKKLREPNASPRELRSKLGEQVIKIDEKIRSLKQMRKLVIDRMENCSGK